MHPDNFTRCKEGEPEQAGSNSERSPGSAHTFRDKRVRATPPAPPAESRCWANVANANAMLSLRHRTRFLPLSNLSLPPAGPFAAFVSPDTCRNSSSCSSMEEGAERRPISNLILPSKLSLCPLCPIKIMMGECENEERDRRRDKKAILRRSNARAPQRSRFPRLLLQEICSKTRCSRRRGRRSDSSLA